MGTDVGDQHRRAGRQDAVDDRMIGRIELRSLLGRQRNDAVAVEHGPDGDPRRLLDQHDAGAVEGDHRPQAIEQGRQHGLAVEAAGERHGRFAQGVGDVPGALLGLVRESEVSHVARDAQHGRARRPRRQAPGRSGSRSAASHRGPETRARVSRAVRSRRLSARPRPTARPARTASPVRGSSCPRSPATACRSGSELAGLT